MFRVGIVSFKRISRKLIEIHCIPGKIFAQWMTKIVLSVGLKTGYRKIAQISESLV